MARTAKARAASALVTPPEKLADRAADLARMLKLSERREPMVVKVATWVGLGIVEGRLAPGDDLNSVELSKRFDSSRTPVREALMLLEQEGLVEIRPRRRPRVAAFSTERVREIYEIRGQLLSIVGRLVAARATEDELTDLSDRVAEMRRKADNDDVVGYFWDHVALQERMTEIAGNTTLKGILDSLALRTLVLRHASLSQPGRLAASIADQEHILRALRERDGDFAATLLARATRAAFGAIEQSGWATDGEWHPDADPAGPPAVARRRSKAS